MADFLDSIIARTSGAPPAVRPLLPTTFEPVRPGWGPGHSPFRREEHEPLVVEGNAIVSEAPTTGLPRAAPAPSRRAQLPPPGEEPSAGASPQQVPDREAVSARGTQPREQIGERPGAAEHVAQVEPGRGPAPGQAERLFAPVVPTVGVPAALPPSSPGPAEPVVTRPPPRSVGEGPEVVRPTPPAAAEEPLAMRPIAEALRESAHATTGHGTRVRVEEARQKPPPPIRSEPPVDMASRLRSLELELAARPSVGTGPAPPRRSSWDDSGRREAQPPPEPPALRTSPRPPASLSAVPAPIPRPQTLVHVSIGRVEVIATPEPAQQPSGRPPAVGPTGLDEYLSRRNSTRR